MLKDRKAVSPVVATLLLILIAVAAAAALYLFVVAFQTNTQKNIGNPTPEPTLVIGGSSILYPLDVNAITWFEQNNSNILINNNQGGSGAGLVSLCQGDVGIAASSEYITQAANIPQTCSNDAVGTRVGTDAIVPLLGGTVNQGITGISLSALRCLYAVNGGLTGSALTSYCGNGGAEGGLAVPSGVCPAAVTALGGGIGGLCYDWQDLPLTPTAPCTYAAPNYAATCVVPGLAVVAPANTGLNVYGRADNAASTFIAQLLDTSCSGNFISNCFPVVKTYTGEQAETQAVQADPYGIGFTSYGYAQSNGIAATFTPAFQGCATYPATSGCALQATPVSPTQSNILNGVYQGWAPLFLYTVGAPAGEAASFIGFVEQPYVNAQLCGEDHFVSYTSGAPNAAGQH